MAAPSTIAQVRDAFPKLGELTDDVLFGDVWKRPGLSKRDRSLITVAALTALYRPHQIRGHIGWPNAGTAAVVAKQVFEERKD